MTTPKNKRAEDSISPDELKKIKQKLRAQAERDVLTNHRDEYNTRVEQLFTDHGLEFKRKLTEEEKQEKELRKVIAENPTLAAKLGFVTDAAPDTQRDDDSDGVSADDFELSGEEAYAEEEQANHPF